MNVDNLKNLIPYLKVGNISKGDSNTNCVGIDLDMNALIKQEHGMYTGTNPVEVTSVEFDVALGDLIYLLEESEPDEPLEFTSSLEPEREGF